MSSSTRSQVILKDKKSWRPWIQQLKATCQVADIWEYLNPDLNQDQLRGLVEPIKPLLPESETEISTTAFQIYSMAYKDYEYERKEWKTKYDAIRGLLKTVLDTVDVKYHTYTWDCDSTYEVLCNLKGRFAPTNDQMEGEVLTTWKSLCQKPDVRDIDQWLQSWETTYDEGIKYNLPDTDGNRPIKSFCIAIATVDQYFSNRWLTKLSKPGRSYDFHEVIQEYRVRRADKALLPQPSGQKGAFSTVPTLNGRNANGERECICSSFHEYQECPYLIEAYRPRNWKANKELEVKVKEALEKKPWIKKLIPKWNEKAIETKKNKKGPEQQSMATDTPSPPSTFAVSMAARGVFQTRVSDYIADVQYELHNSYILDSGATVHVCNNRTRFLNLVPTEDTLIAGNGTVRIEGFGTIEVTTDCPSQPYGVRVIKLTNVAFVPSFHTNVVSLRYLIDKEVHWDTESLTLKWRQTLFCKTPVYYDQWVLEYNPLKAKAKGEVFAVRSKAPLPAIKGTADDFHIRFGHPNPQTLAHLQSELRGIQLIGQPTPNCEICFLKNSRQHVSRRARTWSKIPYNDVWFDIIYQPQGLGDYTKIIHYYDPVTHMHHVYHMISTGQEEILGTMTAFKNLIKTQYNLEIKVWHTDDEQSLGLNFDQMLQKTGQIVEKSAAYAKGQAGGAERSGGVLTNFATALRLQSNLPENLWPEIYKATGYLLNRLPVQGLDWKTPLRVLNEYLKREPVKPTAHHLKAYGCRAYSFIHNRPRLDKLKAKAHIGYLVGYDSTNIFRIWIPQLKRVISARDVDFDETRFFQDNNNDFESQETTEEIVELIETPQLINHQEIEPIDLLPWETTMDNLGDTIVVQSPEDTAQLSILQSKNTSQNYQKGLPTPDETPEPERANEISLSVDSANQEPQSEQRESAEIEIAIPSQEINSDITNTNIRPTRLRGRREAHWTSLEATTTEAIFNTTMLESTTFKPPRLHQQDLPKPPKNWKELAQHSHKEGFIAAAHKEFEALKKKKTFIIVPKTSSSRAKPLPTMWVFTYKFDADGFLNKYKARLVVRGDLQTEQEDTYAATLAARVFRSLMAIAAYFDLDIHQFDAVNAFGNAMIDKLIYIYYPEGMAYPDNNHNVQLELKRALYGLQRSPLLWLNHIRNSLKELGLEPVSDVPCLFVGNDIIVFFYVDDIAVLTRPSDRTKYEAFRTKLMAQFELRELGELQWFLGIRVLRDRLQRKIWLCQDAYIERKAISFNIQFKKIPSSPMALEEYENYSGQATAEQIKNYQQRVGSAIYASIITRGDISKAISILSRYNQNPGPAHRDAIDRLWTYLYGTRYYSLPLGGLESDVTTASLVGSSDASFADNKDTRFSSQGGTYQLLGGLIDWNSQIQKTVTTSSTEAELLASSQVATWLIWWLRVFSSLKLVLPDKAVLQIDNMQTVRLLVTDAQKLSTKLRHVDIHQHWLRQEVKNGSIKIQWVSTTQMPADGFTKILGPQSHKEFVKQLGLQDLAALIQSHQ